MTRQATCQLLHTHYHAVVPFPHLGERAEYMTAESGDRTMLLCRAISTQHVTSGLLILSSNTQIYKYATFSLVKPKCLCVLSVVNSSLLGLLNPSVFPTQGFRSFFKENYPSTSNHLKDDFYFSVMGRKLTGLAISYHINHILV